MSNKWGAVRSNEVLFFYYLSVGFERGKGFGVLSADGGNDNALLIGKGSVLHPNGHQHQLHVF